MRAPIGNQPFLTLLLAAAAAGLAAPSAARANCARPIGYVATVTGSTVSIQPVNFEARGCPAAGGMLRENVATGVAERLADFCGPGGAEPDQGLPYVDECAGPGTYRYGFATPYPCSHAACSTDYFTEVTVPAPDPGCQRSAGNAAPTAFGTPPWGDRQAICTSASGGGCASVPSGSGAVLLLDGAVLLFGLALLRRQRRR